MLTNLHLRNLVILDLSFSYITEDSDLWSQIQMSKKLKVLDLSQCSHLRRVPFLYTFLNLERLLVKFCYKLCSLDGANELESLRCLDATWRRSLETLPDLSRLTKLEELKLEKCDLITDIAGIDKLDSLELLSMSCVSAEKLSELSNLKRLKVLDVSALILTEVQDLGRPKSLEVLVMRGCMHIERVFGLMNLKGLRRLNIQCCPKLIEIHGLEGLESLECLDMGDCKSLETLPDLSKFKSLKTLCVQNCVKLNEIRGFEELESLEICALAIASPLRTYPNSQSLGN
ncbi:hypothetical protein LguiB_013797 [Lonicera macranthoides]